MPPIPARSANAWSSPNHPLAYLPVSNRKPADLLGFCSQTTTRVLAFGPFKRLMFAGRLRAPASVSLTRPSRWQKQFSASGAEGPALGTRHGECKLPSECPPKAITRELHGGISVLPCYNRPHATPKEPAANLDLNGPPGGLRADHAGGSPFKARKVGCPGYSLPMEQARHVQHGPGLRGIPPVEVCLLKLQALALRSCQVGHVPHEGQAVRAELQGPESASEAKHLLVSRSG
jgi:hypothetical protein